MITHELTEINRHRETKRRVTKLKIKINVINYREFGDYYTKAIDETWYKSAVLQHKVDNESFVYAVPHDDKDDVKEEGDIKVMASHAIFRMDAGKEAPGCVVGFQFQQQAMYERFKQITSQSVCSFSICIFFLTFPANCRF